MSIDRWLVARPALAGLVLALALAACVRERSGLEVTGADPWAAAGRAGIEVGDRLVGWRAGGARGSLDSPLDLRVVELDHGFARTVELTGFRGWRRKTFRVAGSDWGLETRPAARASGGVDREGPREARRQARVAEEADRPFAAAWWWLSAGEQLLAGERIDEAAAAFHRASALCASSERHRAAAEDGQARRWLAAGRLDEALAAERRALALREGLDREGGAVAASLHQIGRIALRGQRYGEHRELERAAGILRSLEHGAELHAAVLNLRGSMAWGRREIEEAEGWYRSALEVLAGLGVETPERANLLGNLGLLAELRGEMGAAEELFRAAASMHDRVDPDSVDAAYAANYLGILAKQKGDLAAAELHYRRAAAIFAAELPDGVETAGMLNNLGNLALRRGEPRRAAESHRRALAIRRRVVPDTLDHAASLHNLARAERLRGEPAAAERLLSRALEIKARLAPESLEHSNTLTELGQVRHDQGRLDEAERLHRRALALRRRIAAGRWEWAESLFLLGEIALERGDRRQAERLWRQAIAGIEENRGRDEWDPEERSSFAAPFHRDYRRLASLLVDDGRGGEAFDLLETARARALRSLLAARRLGDPPAEAAPWAGASGRRELARTLERAGAVLLAYSVGEDGALLFVLGGTAGQEPAVHRLALGVEELRTRVEIFRALVARGRRRGGAIEPALVAQGRWLFARLLAPAADAVAAAERVVIVPEGPLLALPFAALVRGDGPDIEWLAGWRPLSVVPSGGVLLELVGAAARAAPGAPRLVAFGDARTGRAPPVAGRRVRGPLPATRSEVERIAALFTDATVRLGDAATEEAVAGLAGGASVLHLALHGLLDERFPLESALAFSPADGGGAEERSDGLLHAWEVVERLELDADLVVLSACDSGRGREVAGEGLVGLARAFQIAGARSVLVSQWPVSDRSTAELMVRFYRHLAAGRGKADALAAAQRELAAAPVPAPGGVLDARHPFAWAGFQLVGDGG